MLLQPIRALVKSKFYYTVVCNTCEKKLLPYHRFPWYATFKVKTPAETFSKFPSIIQSIVSKQQQVMKKHVLIGYQKSCVCLSNLKVCRAQRWRQAMFCTSGHGSILAVNKFSAWTNLVKYNFDRRFKSLWDLSFNFKPKYYVCQVAKAERFAHLYRKFIFHEADSGQAN